MEALWRGMIAKGNCQSLCWEPPLSPYVVGSLSFRMMQSPGDNLTVLIMSWRQPHSSYHANLPCGAPALLHPGYFSTASGIYRGSCFSLSVSSLSLHKAVSPGTRSLTYTAMVPVPRKYWAPRGYMSEMENEPVTG